MTVHFVDTAKKIHSFFKRQQNSMLWYGVGAQMSASFTSTLKAQHTK